MLPGMSGRMSRSHPRAVEIVSLFATMKSKRNITRFSYESTGFKGWRVSVTRHGEIFTRYFSDLKCGGMKKSQKEAERVLAAFLNELDKVPLVRKPRKRDGRVIGVSETSYVNARSGETRVIWVASWPEGDTRKVVKFPETKHGARKAKQLAIAARREAEDRLELGVVKRFARTDVERMKKLLASL